MGGPTGLNSALSIYMYPQNFAHAAVSGAGGVRGTVWRKAAREGWVERARVQRAEKHLVAASRSRVDRFGKFDPKALEDILLPPAVQPEVQMSTGGATRNVPPSNPAHSASPAPTTSGTTAVIQPHPYTAALMRSLFIEIQAIGQLSADHFFPADITLLLDRICHALGKLNLDSLETGQDVEQALERAGITGLKWTHTEKSGSFVTLHRTPKVSGATKDGVLVLAVLPEGHRAPTHVHRSGDTSLPGEITLSIHGPLLYRDYAEPDNPQVFLSALKGHTRVSPKDSRDVYLKQNQLWLGIFWQPEPARIVLEVKSMEALLAKCREQLGSLGQEIRTLASQSSPDLRVIIERREQEYKGKESSELFGIVDNAFTFITNARRTLDQWTTPQLKEEALGKIVAHLIILVAVQNVLTRRGVL